MVREIKTKAEWEPALKDAGDKLVVVDFTATWCGPCQMIGPKFVAMESEFAGVVFLKVDVDENDELAAELGVSAMPTFMCFKNGKKIEELVGANADKLKEMIQKHA